MSGVPLGRYVTYDLKRDVFIQEFEAFDDASACAEFSYFFRHRIGSDGWEHRSFGRYFLMHVGSLLDGELSSFPQPRVVMLDDEVRLDFETYWLADPPCDEASERSCEAEFDRLNRLDAERLERKANWIAELKAASVAPRDCDA